MLQDPRVSTRHAIVRRQDGKVTVQDLGSANGTLVNGDAVEGDEPREVQARRRDPGRRDGRRRVLRRARRHRASARRRRSWARCPPTSARPSRKSTRNLHHRRRGRRARRRASPRPSRSRAAASKETTRHRAHRRPSPEQQVPTHARHPGHHRAEPPATVRIFATLSDDAAASTGSGSVIDQAQGLIITNNHVAGVGAADGAQRPTGQEVPARARGRHAVRGHRAGADHEPRRPRRLHAGRVRGPRDSLSQGEQVIALGYPGTAATARPEEFGNGAALRHQRDHLPDRRRSTTCPAPTSRR